MIACGRRCCLCHKFCGVGMECHHIDQAADEGPNTYENCIPLCFDCHAEVGHYSSNHPKGTKFSAGELRAHRDRWYSRMEQGRITESTPDLLELDKKLFRRVVDVLGGSRRMMHFNDHDYASPYSSSFEDRLSEFARLKALPEAEFFDLTMEAAANDIKESINAYRQAAHKWVFWKDEARVGIPSEWRNGESASEDRFWKAAEIMNGKAQDVWESFSRFVKEGRRTLQVDPEEAE